MDVRPHPPSSPPPPPPPYTARYLEDGDTQRAIIQENDTRSSRNIELGNTEIHDLGDHVHVEITRNQLVQPREFSAERTRWTFRNPFTSEYWNRWQITYLVVFLLMGVGPLGWKITGHCMYRPRFVSAVDIVGMVIYTILMYKSYFVMWDLHKFYFPSSTCYPRQGDDVDYGKIWRYNKLTFVSICMTHFTGWITTNVIFGLGCLAPSYTVFHFGVIVNAGIVLVVLVLRWTLTAFCVQREDDRIDLETRETTREFTGNSVYTSFSYIETRAQPRSTRCSRQPRYPRNVRDPGKRRRPDCQTCHPPVPPGPEPAVQ